MKIPVARIALATSVAFATLVAPELPRPRPKAASDRTSGYRQAPEVLRIASESNYGFGRG